MKMIKTLTLGLVLTALFAASSFAQQSTIARNNLNQVEIDAIVKKFTQNEDNFRRALTNYVFNRSATIQTIGLGGLITGTYRRDSFLTFKSTGERFERITYHPVSTLTEITVSKEDLEDLGGVNPFAIDPRDLASYTFNYLGKQKIDELNLHVFDVRPKPLSKKEIKSGKRLFVGRIWVDDRDLMIVRSKGKGFPEVKKQRFPVIDTWRTNIDGKFWFPHSAYSDDELVFDNGNVVKMKVRVKYQNYKEATSEVTILDDVEEPTEEKKDPEQPKKDN